MTKDQQLALVELRASLYERLKNLSFTEEMLVDKSPYQLICLLELLIGHRNFFPAFTHTVCALEEILGQAIWERPAKSEALSGSKTEVVH